MIVQLNIIYLLKANSLPGLRMYRFFDDQFYVQIRNQGLARQASDEGIKERNSCPYRHSLVHALESGCGDYKPSTHDNPTRLHNRLLRKGMSNDTTSVFWLLYTYVQQSHAIQSFFVLRIVYLTI